MKIKLLSWFILGAIFLGAWSVISDQPAYSGTFEPILDLSTLDGSNGFVIKGINAGDNLGQSGSWVGDFNDDGFEDLIIAAYHASPDGKHSAGESYVVFGTNAGFPASFDLSTLDGTNGFVIKGINAGDNLGGWNLENGVSEAGDVNGDGIDDIIIGAPEADPDGKYSAGESYVVFGTNAGFPASFDLSTLDGTNGFVIKGVDPYDRSGGFVSEAGDVNGDGFDDIIIRCGFNKNCVVFGSSSIFAASLELSALNGSNGFVINGSGQACFASGAGDVNGDGIEDLIIGANLANGYAGESYVVFGSNAGFPASFYLSTLDGTNGFVIKGIDPHDQSGHSVSEAGDFNGDGLSDVIIGAWGADPGGESYVVFGSNAGFAASLELAALNGTNGFVIKGIDPYEYSGWSVSSAGDVNGDGFDDIIIGELQGGYMVFGSNTSFAASLELSALNGDNGFAITGINNSHSAVSRAGDINGDGLDDVIIGDPSSSISNAYAGASYVVYGKTSATPDIGVSPASHDFGNVQWSQTSTAMFTVSNVGSGKLTIVAITLADAMGVFSITSAPSSPPDLQAGDSITVEVTFSPSAIQAYSGVLKIESNDADEPLIEISLRGTGVLDDTPSEQVVAVIDYIEDSIANEELTGEGPGNSADNKVNALINMIEAAGDLLEAGQTTEGCQQLADIYLKVDGVSPSPDFVSGLATEGLTNVIEGLMTFYGCQ